jgi:hypothetical protein
MKLTTDFKSIAKKHGKRYFVNELALSTVPDAIARMDAGLDRIGAALERYGYPTTEETQRGLLESDPAQFLEAKAAAEYERWADQTAQPEYLRENGRRAAAQSVPAGLVAELTAARSNFLGDRSEIKCSATSGNDYVFDKEANRLKVSPSLAEAAEMACYQEITPEMEKAVDLARELVLQARKIEDLGFDAAAILNRWKGSRFLPDERPDMKDAAFALHVLTTQGETLAEIEKRDPERLANMRAIMRAQRDLKGWI